MIIVLNNRFVFKYDVFVGVVLCVSVMLMFMFFGNAFRNVVNVCVVRVVFVFFNFVYIIIICVVDVFKIFVYIVLIIFLYFCVFL